MTTAPSTTKQILRLGTLLLPLLLLGTPGAARASCPVVDFCHQAPFLNPSTQQCDKGPFTGCSIVAVRDAILLLSDRNTNEGANTALWIQEQGPRRITLRFPLAACANDATRPCASSADCTSGAACNAIDTAGLSAATLRMSIRETDTSWSVTGTPVSTYKLGDDFAEGDGKTFAVPVDETEARGTGNGVTYNCATDTNIANTAADCSPQWNAGTSSIGSATSSVNFTSTTTGNVSWDVTADVAVGANRWLVKKNVDGDNGRVAFYSREGAVKAGNAALTPLLTMTGVPYCGNGVLDAGEACDDGNRDNGDCCAYDCTFESASTECRPSKGICDTAETCTGTSATCPVDVVAGAGTECRSSGGECDPAEVCTGSSGECPLDSKLPAGTACTSDGNVCTVDQCNGSSALCQHPAGNAGITCRAATDLCDVAETCTGSSSVCPSDGVASVGTVCRGAAGACDVAETCSGSSKSCPPDVLAGSGTLCRAAASVCDVAEFCTGASANCPSDQFAQAGTICRPSAGDCDIAESCTGSSGTCPPDVGEGDTDSDGLCDVIDPCTNVGGGQDFALKSKLVLSKVGNDLTPDNDKVSLSGSFALPAALSFSSFAPGTRGARVVLLADDGTTLVDAVLPGGSYAGRGTRGWKTNSRGTVWQFLDRTPSRVLGMSDIKLNDRAKNGLGGLVKVSVRGSKAIYPVGVGDAPVRAIIAVGDQTDSIAGRCGETAFAPGNCKWNGPSTTLTCKR